MRKRKRGDKERDRKALAKCRLRGEIRATFVSVKPSYAPPSYHLASSKFILLHFHCYETFTLLLSFKEVVTSANYLSGLSDYDCDFLKSR